MNREAFEALLAQYREAILLFERESQLAPAIWEQMHEEEMRKKVIDAFRR